MMLRIRHAVARLLCLAACSGFGCPQLPGLPTACAQEAEEVFPDFFAQDEAPPSGPTTETSPEAPAPPETIALPEPEELPVVENNAGPDEPIENLEPPDPHDTPRSDVSILAPGRSEAAADELPEPAVEVVRERYPNGEIKTERHVTQDAQQNYVNHGPWKMWDEQGRLIAEGHYESGERQGVWKRHYRPGEAKLLTLPPFDQYQGPFISQASFEQGQLHGEWVILDRNERKICQWPFLAGRRDGKSTWWYPNGNRMREIDYRDGELHGELVEWSPDGEIVTKVQYLDGRRLEKTSQTYPSGRKKYEGSVLRARLVLKDPDRWWEATLATYVREGKDEKHGTWTAWYPNGQKKLEGQYAYDQPSGEFNWWHANGQKSLQAYYVDGKKHGQWIWWHENGQKSIQGQYADDSPVNRWTWWHEKGQVAQRVDFTAAGQAVVSSGSPTPADATSASPRGFDLPQTGP